MRYKPAQNVMLIIAAITTAGQPARLPNAYQAHRNKPECALASESQNGEHDVGGEASHPNECGVPQFNELN
jgi:hypothetical protein